MMRAEYSSNTKSPPGRMFVLVVDSGNMTRGGGRGAMEAAGQFVQKLAPNDLVALVSLPAGVTVDFTADRLAIKNALIKVVGGGANRYLSNTNISLAEAFAFAHGHPEAPLGRGPADGVQLDASRERVRELPDDAGGRRPRQVPHGPDGGGIERAIASRSSSGA